MAPALQSRRRLQRPRIKNHRVAIQIRHNPAHVVSVPRLAMGANRMADVEQLVSDEVARESDVQLRFSGVSSLRGVAGEKMRAEAANG